MPDKKETRPSPGRRRWSSWRSGLAGGYRRKNEREMVIVTRVDERELRVQHVGNSESE